MDIYHPIQTKICSKCGIEKLVSDFYLYKSRKELYNECKCCIREKTKEYQKNNKEKTKEYKKQWYDKNRDYIIQKSKQYNQNNKEKTKEYQKQYGKDYKKNKRSNDSIFKLKGNIACLIRHSIKKRGFMKKTKTTDILGCDIQEFKEHLESQFDENMNWSNHGTYWDIDHIIPISSGITENDIIRLNHYTNLQPLEKNYNRYVKRNFM